MIIYVCNLEEKNIFIIIYFLNKAFNSLSHAWNKTKLFTLLKNLVKNEKKNHTIFLSI